MSVKRRHISTNGVRCRHISIFSLEEPTNGNALQQAESHYYLRRVIYHRRSHTTTGRVTFLTGGATLPTSRVTLPQAGLHYSRRSRIITGGVALLQTKWYLPQAESHYHWQSRIYHRRSHITTGGASSWQGQNQISVKVNNRQIPLDWHGVGGCPDIATIQYWVDTSVNGHASQWRRQWVDMSVNGHVSEWIHQ